MEYEKQISDLSKAIFGLNQSVDALRKNTESRNNFEQFAYGQGVSKFDDRLSTSYPKQDSQTVSYAGENYYRIFQTSINVKGIRFDCLAKNGDYTFAGLLVQFGYALKDLTPLNLFSTPIALSQIPKNSTILNFNFTRDSLVETRFCKEFLSLNYPVISATPFGVQGITANPLLIMDDEAYGFLTVEFLGY